MSADDAINIRIRVWLIVSRLAASIPMTDEQWKRYMEYLAEHADEQAERYEDE